MPELKRRETVDALHCALNEAGIEGASVTAVQDPSRGTVLNVALPDHAMEAAAASVLGGFPFPFTILAAGASAGPQT